MRSPFRFAKNQPPWDSIAPVREELFGVERLESHAESLAAAQAVTTRPPAVLSLHRRLGDNAAVLLVAYRADAAEVEAGREIVNAAEWLLDNYHLVEAQIREIKDDLPPGYYRQLPKLADGPFAGYPRVFGLTWAYVAHTDSHFSPETLRRFIAAYQRVQPLTIGELWAVAITLRIVLVENLRRLADQITVGRATRAEADRFADQVLQAGKAPTAMAGEIAARAARPLSERFAAQLARRLRDQDPRTTPAREWLEERLAIQGLSVDEAVQHAQQRQGASNVSVRNVITSMRLIADIDWAELFESVSLVDAHLRDASDFAAMDFATRNLYRNAIEQLARSSSWSELAIADQALASAGDAVAGRAHDPGYHLIAEGRPALERAIGFRPPARLQVLRFNLRLGIGFYVGAIALVGLVLLALAVAALAAAGLGPLGCLLFAVVAFLPASDTATALVNRAVAWSFGANPLPGLELNEGVPAGLRTLIAMPVLFGGPADVREAVDRLEIHYLSGQTGDLNFALLSDGVDADSEDAPEDAGLIAAAAAAIAQLNRRYPGGPGGERFLLLHRRRTWNAGEGKWMGWERKRGKLHELNQLLRGAETTNFIAINGEPPTVPENVRYVITLDADTRLPRDAGAKLIGKMAHPLNRPVFAGSRIIGGYAILQPRVSPAMPLGAAGSLYQRIISGPGGIDPYAAAVSDVYQDLFGEGSYTGKGIYDVDAFETALAGLVPENALLSHDLFEGSFARAGLASDLELIEEFPSRYDVDARRHHRWIRGDWQLLPWVFGGPAHQVSAVARGKMLDNLRRSLLAPALLLTIVLCWLLPMRIGGVGLALLLASAVLPPVLPLLSAIIPRRTDVRVGHHLALLAGDAGMAALRIVLLFAFLADQAWRHGDAIGRTLIRLLITRRHLLEWTTAAQMARAARPDLAGYYRQMAGGILLGVALGAAALAIRPAAWPMVLPFLLLWAAAPALAFQLSRPAAVAPVRPMTASDALQLRLIARRTWRFFETFVTPADNMLPPDNFQDEPKPVIARRTSPTNIGLYLLATAAARDFGWAGTMQTVERLEASIATLQKMPRFNGHFYNWYATEDLRVLQPAYVSAVDSGNLAGHLITLANACEEWAARGPGILHVQGIGDHLRLARLAAPAASGAALAPVFDEMEAQLGGAQSFEIAAPVVTRLAAKASALLGQDSEDAAYWIAAIAGAVAEHGRDRAEPDQAPMRRRLLAIADIARELALAMDFSFLLDPERKLLSIGFSCTENSLDLNCYDLLASEARLASLFAIAKGDVPTRHWFRLGRAETPVGSGAALISWSGSMFEYLMPSLVMQAPGDSLLARTNRLVVARQQDYAKAKTRPWGISESAYNARDIELTYQYSNFGVPGLGLKRGLAENFVIAPYATGLAAMVDPAAARVNFSRLEAMGALGRYGFYEALDFTRSRLPDHQEFVIVRNVMAHHQGMTVVALANTLLDAPMRRRFHREPMIQASELLLQERVPRDVAVAPPRAEEVKAAAAEGSVAPPAMRRLTQPAGGAPVTHLLSNGRYTVMLTASGAGYSHWRDIAITRWRADATRDDEGYFIFVRDLRDGKPRAMGMRQAGMRQAGMRQAGARQPGMRPAEGSLSEAVIFAEDHAEFSRREGELTTTMDVIVSGEDDAEVRRISIVNSGRRPREMELTSYAELVLTTPATDNAHPAFAKMFVQTEYLAEFGALIATRRPRSPEDTPVWAAHFAVVEGELTADPQYESDRARFIGRNRSIATAAALAKGAILSGTAGTVLDPVFSVRLRVLVPPGKSARVAFWTVVAPSRELLMDLIDRHHDRNAFQRAKTLAWTQGQVQLRHLGMEGDEAAEFQRLAAPLLYADPRFRAPSAAIIRGAGPQSAIWVHGISGDLSIVLMRIDDIDDIGQVHQLLRAHEYWRLKRLSADLVIINERASSYIQDLQIAIETAVRSSQARPRLDDAAAKGSVYTLRADLIGIGARELLQSVARVALVARRGSIAAQLALLPRPPAASPAMPAELAPLPVAASPLAKELEFFNGIGGFGDNGREYVTILKARGATPAPWVNVIANPGFGFHVSAAGSAYTWAGNSRENQLTPWSNDPVADPAGEAMYVRDEVSGEFFTATAQPVNDGGIYVARHGFGYSRFTHQAGGIELELLCYVPLADPVKISRLTLRNLGGTPRRLSVTAYAELVLGTARGATAPYIISSIDAETGALLAHNPWSNVFAGRNAFADLGGKQTGWTADRMEFLGSGGGMAAPAALTGNGVLSRRTGAGFDPCAALQCGVELGPNEAKEIVWLFGQCEHAEAVAPLLAKYRQADLDAVLSEVTGHWRDLLGSVTVKTPDRAMDIMLNGWLLYQTLACRVWARAGFYQASGAYGFRDQLQDGMALTFARPAETRGHLLRAAGRQFLQGDVQHWWLPHSGQGVRTGISDDRVWLAYAAATYVTAAGDETVLDELVPFLEGPMLEPGQHDAFFQPMIADETASLFEHCARGLDQSIAMSGVHGLPLMGTGDWNDGMSRVGAGGRGESVWLAWLLVRTIDLFAGFADARDPTRAAHWRAHAAETRLALDREAWDGAWYRRATFDDGTWLGSKDSEECQIDSIAQSWSVLAGGGDARHAATAMASLESRLIRHDDAIALLFTPPFDVTPHDPGYIKGYPPGLRENGGQYSHAAMWVILALTKMGEGDKAAGLFSLLNPINHARNVAEAARYKVEPYVLAADVYSVAPHAGRGGWTWYTGSAGWMQRVGIEGILGIRREGAWLLVEPCLPAGWPGFEAVIRLGDNRYDIRVDNSSGKGMGVTSVTLDGAPVGAPVRVPLNDAAHVLVVTM